MASETLGVYRLRRTARKRARYLRQVLMQRQRFASPAYPVATLTPYGPLPLWVRSVRVEKAGRFQWTVVGTGHD